MARAADAALVLPLARAGSERPYGVLVAGVSPRRELDNDYRAFLDIVTSHISQALANAEAYEEERKRAEALAEIDRAKTTFFSNVSHEFRTPLTLMLGPLEELRAMDDVLLPSVSELVTVAHRSGLRLQKLVNSLLDFSRIEAGRMRALYEPTDLAALHRRTGFHIPLRHRKGRAPTGCGVPAARRTRVCGSRDVGEGRAEPALERLQVHLQRQDHGPDRRARRRRARLTVEDTGTGIPEDELPHLFERFHRVEGARGRTQEGTGIGLALVAELVKLHGGTVEVRSTVGQGTAFTVALPFGAAHLPREHMRRGARPECDRRSRGDAYVEEAARWLPQQRSARPRDSGARQTAGARRPAARVLVADDNADMRDYVARLLAGEYEVETVSNGAEALKRVAIRPDLVLSDVMMPELDGFGLLQALRGNPATRARCR